MIRTLLITIFVLLALPSPRTADAGEERSLIKKRGFTKIGVIEFRDETNLIGAGRLFTERVVGRLDTTKGIKVKKIGISLKDRTPILLGRAVTIGKDNDVEAIIVGKLMSIEIFGGIYPTWTNKIPKAKGKVKYRVVETTKGIPVAFDFTAEITDWRTYPATTRDSEELREWVMIDLAKIILQQLKDKGVIGEKGG